MEEAPPGEVKLDINIYTKNIAVHGWEGNQQHQIFLLL